MNQADKELLRGIGAGKVQGASMTMTPTSTVRAARQIPRTSNRATPAGTAAAACTLVQLNHFLRPASVVGHQGQGDRLVLVSRIRVEVVQERAHLPNRGDHGNIRGRLLADLRVLDWR
jgi:hypothetical protein